MFTIEDVRDYNAYCIFKKIVFIISILVSIKLIISFDVLSLIYLIFTVVFLFRMYYDDYKA